ncbi:hypothetical protein MMC29_004562, partial [Sticta canariensis]|nr:hypothetical protein [Sticta canariensis]
MSGLPLVDHETEDDRQPTPPIESSQLLEGGEVGGEESPISDSQSIATDDAFLKDVDEAFASQGESQQAVVAVEEEGEERQPE